MAKKAKKVKPIKAFTTYHPAYGINPYWIRSEARKVREAVNDWQRVKRAGWRVVRLKVFPDFKR